MKIRNVNFGCYNGMGRALWALPKIFASFNDYKKVRIYIQNSIVEKLLGLPHDSMVRQPDVFYKKYLKI